MPGLLPLLRGSEGQDFAVIASNHITLTGECGVGKAGYPSRSLHVDPFSDSGFVGVAWSLEPEIDRLLSACSQRIPSCQRIHVVPPVCNLSTLEPDE